MFHLFHFTDNEVEHDKPSRRAVVPPVPPVPPEKNRSTGNNGMLFICYKTKMAGK